MNKAGYKVLAFICYALIPAIHSEYVDISDKVMQIILNKSVTQIDIRLLLCDVFNINLH